jgi:hypothetical protein
MEFCQIYWRFIPSIRENDVNIHWYNVKFNEYKPGFDRLQSNLWKFDQRIFRF